MARGSHFDWACPICRSPLAYRKEGFHCPDHDRLFRNREGIWRFLVPELAQPFSRFVQNYQVVRQSEGRGFADSRRYRELPSARRDNPYREQWRIRAKSYRALLRNLSGNSGPSRPRLRILDLGAGNCWLSNRLLAQGHQVASVDLIVNDWDGLGAWRHYEPKIVAAEADFDHLPFAADQFDLAVYNASFHYTRDASTSLGEALRALRPGGRVVIMDTPVYQDRSSGEEMVAEREREFRRLHGLASDALASENFLTEDRLDELASRHQIDWQRVQPFYGLGWSLKPWKARLRGHREPARFMLLIGQRKGRPR